MEHSSIKEPVDVKIFRKIASVISDPEETDQLLHALLDRNSSSSYFHTLLKECSNNSHSLVNFPWSYHLWLYMQIQPFITHKANSRGGIDDDSLTCPIASSSGGPTRSLGSPNNSVSPSTIPNDTIRLFGDSSRDAAASVNSNHTHNSKIISDDNMLDAVMPRKEEVTATTFAGIPITVKSKQKKRVQTVQTTPSDFSATNMVSGNISSLPDSGLSIRSIKASFMEEKARGESPKSSVISQKVTVKPSAFRQASVYSDLYSIEVLSSAALVTADVYDMSVVQRLASIYTTLVINQYIPIVQAITLLTRAVCSSDTDSVRQIKVNVANSDKFPTLISSSRCMQAFVCALMQGLKPVVKQLGNTLIKAMASNAIVRSLQPELSSELLALVEESGDITGSIDETHRLGPELFIRQFREEVDSRNEYKSPDENAVYNERERCYDEFSNLLRRFQEIYKSDLDGSNLIDYIRNLLPVSGHKILGIRDINFVWFAEIFKQMLLFYSLNSAATATTSTSSSKVSGTASRGVSIGTPSSSSTDQKKRMLEERIGVGGKAYQSPGIFNQPSMHSQQQQQQYHQTPRKSSVDPKMRSGLNTDVYELPSLQFPGNQQFFFRFIVHLDNHRLCQCLEASFTSEIYNLTGDSDLAAMSALSSPPSSHERSETAESYTSRILKLKVLGKFLGLLHFYPKWTLTVNATSEGGPMAVLLEEAARSRAYLRSTYPVKECIEKAWATNKISLAVSWVAAFLKMMVWDKMFQTHNPYGDVLSLLKSVQRSEQYHILARTLSPNKTFVLMELQELWQMLPIDEVRSMTLSTVHAHASFHISDGRYASLQQHLDQGNAAFSFHFLAKVTPQLHQCIHLMVQSTASSPSKTSHSQYTKTMKRQTPSPSPSVMSNNSLANSFSFVSSTPLKLTPSLSSSKLTVAVSSQSAFGSGATASTIVSSSSSSQPASGGIGRISGFVSPSSVSPRYFQSSSPDVSVTSSTGRSTHHGANSRRLSTIDEALEITFWQQHPSLHQIFLFILDNLRNVCLVHVKQIVADAIHLLWDKCAQAKFEALESIPTVTGTANTHSGDDRDASKSQHADIVKYFQKLLDQTEGKLHADTITDGNQLLDQFITKYLTGILPSLCSLYPCHARVSGLAEQLIIKEARCQQQNFLVYLDSFSRRKFSEVVSASVRQLQKTLDGQLLAASGGRLHQNSEIPVSPTLTKIHHNNSSSHHTLIVCCINKIATYFTIKPLSSSEAASIHEVVGLFQSNCRSFTATVNTNRVLPSHSAKSGRGTSVLASADEVRFRNHIVAINECIKETLFVLGAAYSFAQAATSSIDIVTDEHITGSIDVCLHNVVPNVVVVFDSFLSWISETSATKRIYLEVDGSHSASSRSDALFFVTLLDETVDKLLIEAVKLLTLTFPLLVYFDSDAIRHVLPTADGSASHNRVYATNLLIDAMIKHRIINMNTFVHIIAATSRQSTVSHYASYRFLFNLPQHLYASILQLIGRYLSKLKDVQLDINTISDATSASYEEDMWYHDNCTLQTIKTAVSPELSSLISKIVPFSRSTSIIPTSSTFIC